MKDIKKIEDIENIVVEGAKIVYRNFSGKPSDFNRTGDRSFCLVIDDDKEADRLSRIGWNIKVKEPKEEGGDKFIFLPVAVRFTHKPPVAYLINKSGHKVRLTEETIGDVDDLEIENIDLVIRPYVWEYNGNHGIKAYLKALYVKGEENELSSKYEEPSIPVSGDDEDVPF